MADGTGIEMRPDDTESIELELDGVRWRGISELSKLRFKSLPARIITSVFAAALVTLLCTTWISSRSIESFVRAKIDQKFSTILWRAGERLDLWYAQREIDLTTFARSPILADSLREAGDTLEPDRKELANYLTYVLELFPQFDSLFVLDPRGKGVIAVGDSPDLPEAWIERLSDIRVPQVGPLERLGERRVQIASAPVAGDTGRRLATLHAVLRTKSIIENLRSEDSGTPTLVYVVGPDGRVLLEPPGGTFRERYERHMPEEQAAPSVEEYQLADGTTVVGSAVDFPRFGWTLVVEEPYDAVFAPVVRLIREILGINLGIVLVFCIIALQIARSIVRPIRELSKAALRIKKGETGVMIHETASDDEIRLLTRVFNKMSLQLQENRRELEENRREIEDANTQLTSHNQELQRVNEVFEQLSITDELTRLRNHRYFQEHLPRETKRAERTGEALCLILIDIDDFKGLNDRHGHAAGDTVLRGVAEVMLSIVRDTDLLARYGGEEFALLTVHTDTAGAVVLAEKIRAAISEARFAIVGLEGPKELQLTASFGVARFCGDEKRLFTDADRALYRAKERGKNCVVVADEKPVS